MPTVMTKIDTEAELSELVRSEAAAGRLDVRVEEQSLRELWNIDASISDRQITQALTEFFRSETNPHVVMTLFNGPILASAEIGEGFTIEDEFWAFQADLELVHGKRVWLMPTKPNATGFGVLTAYRMPRGSYRWGDENLVGRYGVEVGRYAQFADRPSEWATA
jgi:hypothetical protein